MQPLKQPRIDMSAAPKQPVEDVDSDGESSSCPDLMSGDDTDTAEDGLDDVPPLCSGGSCTSDDDDIVTRPLVPPLPATILRTHSGVPVLPLPSASAGLSDDDSLPDLVEHESADEDDDVEDEQQAYQVVDPSGSPFAQLLNKGCSADDREPGLVDMQDLEEADGSEADDTDMDASSADGYGSEPPCLTDQSDEQSDDDAVSGDDYSNDWSETDDKVGNHP
eukprot:jgi/Chrzof1/964/Cz01g35020.t1